MVQGTSENGVRRFLSLPYAAPLTDVRRFRAPQPVEPWTGIRDATRSGPSAPQNHGEFPGIDMAALMGAPDPAGPDYLTLNLWTPEGAAKRPVMVFIHGGSFVAGSKDAPVYDGSAFARDGVLCVTINYRLGIEGFLPIPGVPTNLGLRDAIAALTWVRDNIAIFGGDSDNVTIFGESAGAAAVAMLTLSPLAKGLFARAICQSGHAELSREAKVMRPIVKRLARRLKISADRDGFASLPPEALLEAQLWIAKPSLFLDMRDADGRDITFGTARFIPVHGDDVLPERPIDALKNGAGADVDLLIGTTSEEANLFFAPGDGGSKLRRWQLRLVARRAVPKSRKLLQAYGLDDRDTPPVAVFARVMTDLFFRAITRRTAELHQGRTWVFEFDWRSPALGGKLGAAHAVELPFVFDTLNAASGPEGLLGDNPPQALADTIHALWTGFATQGSMPWQQYDAATRQVYSLTHGTAWHEPLTPAANFLP